MNNPADDDKKFDTPDIPSTLDIAAIADIADSNLNDREMRRQVVAQKLIDTHTPGFQAEFDPDEAELLGAFKEDALSENDALDSSIDQPHSVDGGQ
ncbi:hypothetical protein [Nitrosomonas marina]|uniref:Uncharacterized protein n=1 Tax=Nitrosomonas marina TaxID=917 RepID=A0A1H8FUV8_9PROT|nr:hypothetical protein [Nitrosomonas marina]SEN34878.1 hypothetical protein SAMN05216325_11478 [Nitrosomonas marina]